MLHPDQYRLDNTFPAGKLQPCLPDLAGPYLISFHLCHLGFRVSLNPEVPWLIFGFSLKLLEVLNHVPCFLPYLFPLSLGMEFRSLLALPQPFLRVKA
jgi:hypothetical protein